MVADSNFGSVQIFGSLRPRLTITPRPLVPRRWCRRARGCPLSYERLPALLALGADLALLALGADLALGLELPGSRRGNCGRTAGDQASLALARLDLALGVDLALALALGVDLALALGADLALALELPGSHRGNCGRTAGDRRNQPLGTSTVVLGSTPKICRMMDMTKANHGQMVAFGVLERCAYFKRAVLKLLTKRS